MRKIFAVCLLMLGTLLLVSCNKPSTISNIEIPISKYKDATSLTIEETTTIQENNDNILQSNRKTYVDVASNYTYATIHSESLDSTLYQNNTDFYYTKNDTSTKCKYIDTNDVFQTLGYSKLFSYSDFSYEPGLAKKNITGTYVLDYTTLFDNINQEFEKDYIYNPSILKVSISYTAEQITKIEFDLSLIFSSYCTSVIREVTFSFDAFEKISLDIDITKPNTKYEIETASTLDTYVQEMVYQYGDSIYIKSGDFDMLIDAGQYADGANVNTMLQQYCTDHTLDVLIATHGHDDHLGGFSNGALNSIENINLIIDYGYQDNYNRIYEPLRNSYISKGADYYSAYDCVNFINGASKTYQFSEDLVLEVLDTNQYRKTNEVLTSNQYGAENDFSVVVKLQFKTNSYLYTGDLSGELENAFTTALMQEDIKDITVYKAAHHGANSHESNNQEFLNYVNPKICVSSAAIVDSDYPADHSSNGSTVYQHPRPAFVRWILNTPTIQNTKEYYFNGTMGTIHLIDDGQNLPTITGLGATKGYNIDGEKITGEENKRFYDTQMYQQYYLR